MTIKELTPEQTIVLQSFLIRQAEQWQLFRLTNLGVGHIPQLSAMSKTFRKIIKRKTTIKWMRQPKHKHKLLAGQSAKTIVTDWDDKTIAAIKEMKHKL